jgi:hypothetical protein
MVLAGLVRKTQSHEKFIQIHIAPLRAILGRVKMAQQGSQKTQASTGILLLYHA